MCEAFDKNRFFLRDPLCDPSSLGPHDISEESELCGLIFAHRALLGLPALGLAIESSRPSSEKEVMMVEELQGHQADFVLRLRALYQACGNGGSLLLSRSLHQSLDRQDEQYVRDLFGDPDYGFEGFALKMLAGRIDPNNLCSGDFPFPSKEQILEFFLHCWATSERIRQIKENFKQPAIVAVPMIPVTSLLREIPPKDAFLYSGQDGQEKEDFSSYPLFGHTFLGDIFLRGSRKYDFFPLEIEDLATGVDVRNPLIQGWRFGVADACLDYTYLDTDFVDPEKPCRDSLPLLPRVPERRKGERRIKFPIVRMVESDRKLNPHGVGRVSGILELLMARRLIIGNIEGNKGNGTLDELRRIYEANIRKVRSVEGKYIVLNLENTMLGVGREGLTPVGFPHAGFGFSTIGSLLGRVDLTMGNLSAAYAVIRLAAMETFDPSLLR